MQTYPLFEFDPNPRAVLEPDHEALGLQLPEKLVLAFVGENVIEAFVCSHQGRQVGCYETFAKNVPVYAVTVAGETLGLCQGLWGAPAAAALLDWLRSYGVRTVLATGSCGALVQLPEGAFLLPTRALRDEGTSCHYQEPARWIDLDASAVEAWEQTLEERGIPVEKVHTWTTDGFFRETREKVQARRAEGCSVVEMECAALAACARFREICFGMLLFTADSLAALDHHDQRDWGRNSHMSALDLCFAALQKL